MNLGYRGYDVMWWMCCAVMNCMKASKGGIFCKNFLGVCIVRIFPGVQCMAFLVLEAALKMEGYLLNVSQICRCSFWSNVKKSVARSCQGPSWTSLRSIGCVACCFLLCTDGTSLYIVNYMCLYWASRQWIGL